MNDLHVDLAPFSLRPFTHQVAGHFLVLEINKDMLCKPLVSREKFFYDTIPEGLKEFAPKFQGVILVQFSKDDKGNVHYIGYNRSPSPPLSPSTQSASESTCSAMTSTDEEEELEKLSHLKCSLRNEETKLKSFNIPFDGDSFHNPWTQSRLNVFSKGIAKSNHTERHEYIILENLTGKYSCPCVLDLKIGTRSHNDVMSPQKKQEHLDRSASTTSLKLGIRFCGMQLYNPIEKCYHFRDKYYGHSLTEDTINDAIKGFVFDGVRYRVDAIRKIVQRLKKLRDVISQLNTYRFFSSSLLIMYEGDQGFNDASEQSQSVSVDSNVDIRMIDFANLTHSGFVNDPIVYDGPDEGYILGLTTLVRIFESLLE